MRQAGPTHHSFRQSDRPSTGWHGPVAPGLSSIMFMNVTRGVGVQGIRQKGFTLIELMITVAIVAILAAVAYPSYTRYVIRANRSAAQAQMLDIANRQQQFLLSNRTYATTAMLASSGYALPTELSTRYSYSITVGTSTVPAYTITFTASGAQASDGALTFNSEGVKAPAEKW
jgi:type IV pilus assembly protein PilE